jgi:hypothetical protein
MFGEMCVVFGTDLTLIPLQKPSVTILIKQIENQQEIYLRKFA